LVRGFLRIVSDPRFSKKNALLSSAHAQFEFVAGVQVSSITSSHLQPFRLKISAQAENRSFDWSCSPKEPEGLWRRYF
jgi:hypothetical protein